MRIGSREIKAILFDFFGTLTTAIQRGPAHAAIARTLGCDPTTMARALDRTFRSRCRGDHGSPAFALRALAVEQGADPSPAAVAEAVEARITAVRADVVLRPRAIEVLHELRHRGLRTAVVSDCWYELPVLLPTLPIAPLLDAMIYSYHLGRCKPDLAIYEAACLRLRITPQRCLYVGDGGGRELSGARAAGMTPLRLAEDDLVGHLTFDPEPGWDGPVIGKLEDVLSLIRGLSVILAF